jgi:VanZ family protein
MSNKLLNFFAISLACAFLGFIIWIIYLANTGGSSVFFDLIKFIPYGDKVGHLLLFGTLTYIANLALQFRCFNLGKYAIYYGSVLVGVFVLVEEISQGYIATRTFDVADLAADAVGIGLFSYFSWLTQQFLCKKQTEA